MRRSTIFDQRWVLRLANGPVFALAEPQLRRDLAENLILGSTNGSCFVAMRYKGSSSAGKLEAMESRNAKFGIGQVVKHRFYPFRGVIFDVDPVFSNTEEWWRSIPSEVRPAKEQPFYHLYAENEDSQYVAYVSEQNLMSDESGEPVRHPQVSEAFDRTEDGTYSARDRSRLS
jgi:heat shock protein HspQ